MTAMMPRSRIREIPQSTAFRAYWTAFNVYSNPGFSVYPDQDSFEDIYQSLQRYGGRSWALAEGTNLTLGSPPTQSPLTWKGIWRAASTMVPRSLTSLAASWDRGRASLDGQLKAPRRLPPIGSFFGAIR